MTKKCIVCKKIKTIENFSCNPNCTVDGYLNQCKKCISKKRKENYQKKKREKRAYSIKYRKENLEKVREADKIYSQTERGKEVRKKNRLKWIEKHPEENKKAKDRWRENNKQKRKEYYQRTKNIQIQQNLKKRKENIQLKLRHNISNLIRQRLKRRLSGKKGKSTFDFLPYTLEDLMQHLKKQFTVGMTWGNCGKWHIDHKIADCKFNYKTVEDKEFQKCWALENLQPLWAMDNFKKNRY